MMSYKAWRRACSGKTPLWKLRLRFYGFVWLVFWPILYLLFGGKDFWSDAIRSWAVAIGVFLVATTALTCFSGKFVGFMMANSPNYQAWRQAGGHPFYDLLYFFNSDPPQVRAAIGIPPQEPFCQNCGASISGLFGLGGDFGNVCHHCGACNDYFPPELLRGP